MEIKKVEYRPLFINGKWVEPKSGMKKDVICPATGQVIGQYALAGEEDVADAIEAAQKAYDDFFEARNYSGRAIIPSSEAGRGKR